MLRGTGLEVLYLQLTLAGDVCVVVQLEVEAFLSDTHTRTVTRVHTITCVGRTHRMS